MSRLSGANVSLQRQEAASAASEPIQILVVGEKRAGKTSLVDRLIKDVFDENVKPTTRLNQVDFELRDLKALNLTEEELRLLQPSVTLTIRDLGGGITVTDQDKVENLKIVRDDAVMLVFDGTKSFSSRNAQKEPVVLAKWKTNFIQKHAPEASVMVVANKLAGEIDQNQLQQKADSFSIADMQEFVNNWNEDRKKKLEQEMIRRSSSFSGVDVCHSSVQSLQTSAKQGYNVQEVFNQLASAVLRRRLAPYLKATEAAEAAEERRESNRPSVDMHNHDEVAPTKVDDKDKGCCACSVM